MISGLSHIAIRCRNINESICYYTQILGLREAFRMQGANGEVAAVYLYIAPSEFIELFSGGIQKNAAGDNVIGMCHICLETKNVHKTYECVKQLGGPLDSEVVKGKAGCLMFWTHDPDGNSLEIMQLPPESLQAKANHRFEQIDKNLQQNSSCIP